MLIPITETLWVDPQTVVSVELVTKQEGQYVEIHTAKRWWSFPKADLAAIVARVNAREPREEL